MQRPSSRSYRLGYLAYYTWTFRKYQSFFDEVSRVHPQPPNQPRVQKCSFKSIFPNFNFSLKVSNCSVISYILCLCAYKSDTTLQKRYKLFLITFICYHLITSLTLSSPANHRSISITDSAYFDWQTKGLTNIACVNTLSSASSFEVNKLTNL